MKKTVTFILTKFLLPAFGLYTLFTLAIALPSSTKGLTREKLWLLFFVAAAIAAANLIFYIKKIGIYFKVATHFLLLGGILLAALYFSGFMETGNWVLILIAYAIAYAIVCPIVLLIYFGQKKKKSADKDYTPRFDNIKKK